MKSVTVDVAVPLHLKGASKLPNTSRHTCTTTISICTVEPPNKGHFGTNLNCSLWRGCPLLVGSNCIKMFYVERFIILCPYLKVSTIVGFTVHVHVTSCWFIVACVCVQLITVTVYRVIWDK